MDISFQRTPLFRGHPITEDTFVHGHLIPGWHLIPRDIFLQGTPPFSGLLPSRDILFQRHLTPGHTSHRNTVTRACMPTKMLSQVMIAKYHFSFPSSGTNIKSLGRLSMFYDQKVGTLYGNVPRQEVVLCGGDPWLWVSLCRGFHW